MYSFHTLRFVQKNRVKKKWRVIYMDLCGSCLSEGGWIFAITLLSVPLPVNLKTYLMSSLIRIWRCQIFILIWKHFGVNLKMYFFTFKFFFFFFTIEFRYGDFISFMSLNEGAQRICELLELVKGQACINNKTV